MKLHWSSDSIVHTVALTLTPIFRKLNKVKFSFITPRVVSSSCLFISFNYPRMANHRGPHRGVRRTNGVWGNLSAAAVKAPHQHRWHAGHPHPISASPRWVCSQPIIKQSCCVPLSQSPWGPAGCWHPSLTELEVVLIYIRSQKNSQITKEMCTHLTGCLNFFWDQHPSINPPIHACVCHIPYLSLL